MAATETIERLTQALADTYALSLKTLNFHWNVTGPEFSALHALFEEQYSELTSAIDLIAERIRMLGAKTPANFTLFNQLKTIDDGNENLSANEMVKTLAEDNHKIQATLNQVFTAAQKIDDEVTMDMMIGRLEIHQKNVWILESSL